MILMQKAITYTMHKNWGKNHLDIKFSDLFKIFSNEVFQWILNSFIKIVQKILDSKNELPLFSSLSKQHFTQMIDDPILDSQP